MRINYATFYCKFAPHANRGSLALVTLMFVATGCGDDPDRARREPAVQAEYDQDTGRLQQLTYDSNNDGHVDIWTYMDGTTIVRVEMDRDEDGRLDRWEYYGEAQTVEKVGLSRLNDGTPDAWAYPGEDGTIARMEVSTARDGTIDRWEWYEVGALIRSEEDTDRDGLPDRRLTYDVGGRLVSIERAPDGDGQFTETVPIER